MHSPSRHRPEFDEAQFYEYPQHLREAIDDPWWSYRTMTAAR